MSKKEKVYKMTDEQIERINKEWKIEEEKRNFIIKKAKDKDFDLNKMFTETIDILGSISTEDILYLYEDKYKHLYSSEEFMHQELDSICKYINDFYKDNKMEYPPFYIGTYFGIDIYLKYNDELFRYFFMKVREHLKVLLKVD